MESKIGGKARHTTKAGEIKICAGCGAEFGCNTNNGKCWCETYSLNAKTLELLRSTYAECLCSDCLKSFEAK